MRKFIIIYTILGQKFSAGRCGSTWTRWLHSCPTLVKFWRRCHHQRKVWWGMVSRQPPGDTARHTRKWELHARKARLYCSLLETMEGYYQVCAIISTSCHVTCHVMFILIAGVLLYFSDGLLPLLQAYYEVFFEPPQDAYSRERQMNTSAKIATALLVWEVTKINLCS